MICLSKKAIHISQSDGQWWRNTKLDWEKQDGYEY